MYYCSRQDESAADASAYPGDNSYAQGSVAVVPCDRRATEENHSVDPTFLEKDMFKNNYRLVLKFGLESYRLLYSPKYVEAIRWYKIVVEIMMVEMESLKKKYSNSRTRVCGQLFESIRGAVYTFERVQIIEMNSFLASLKKGYAAWEIGSMVNTLRNPTIHKGKVVKKPIPPTALIFMGWIFSRILHEHDHNMNDLSSSYELSTLTWSEKQIYGKNRFRGVGIECDQIVQWMRFNGIMMPKKN